MFELEGAISKWKHRLAAAGSFTGESLAELESHVRDSHADLVAKGLDSEESFLLATRRVGDPYSHQAEYAKEYPIWQHRVLWMLVGILAFRCLDVLATLVRDVGVLIALAIGAHGRAVSFLPVAFTVAGYAMIAWSIYLLRKRLLAGVASRPVFWLATAVALIIVGSGLRLLASAGTVRLLDASDFVFFASLYAYVGAALAVLVPVALSITIARLRSLT
jgi:hypothetical protein